MSRRAASVSVIVLSRNGCHLCHVAFKMLARLREERHFHLALHPIDHDVGLIARFGDRVPVVLINNVERFAGRVSERDLRQAIKWARWTGSISRILSRLGLIRTGGDHFS